MWRPAASRIDGGSHQLRDGADLFDQRSGAGDLTRRAEHGGVDGVEGTVAHGIVDE